MNDIKFTDRQKEEIKKDLLVKKNKKMPMLVVLIILIAMLFLNKDTIISGYNKLFPKADVSENGPVEKTEEPPKEESNFIKDTYLNKIDRAEDVKRKANLRDIKLALELHFAENGSYPASPSPVKLNDATSSIYKDLIKYTSPDNMKDPKDPEYFYLYKSDGKSFEISARLENVKDPECEIAENGFCIYKTSGTSEK